MANLKKLNLFWFNNEKIPNFGDVLNPWLIGRLTELPINYLPLDKMGNSKWMAVKVLLKKVLDGSLNLMKLKEEPEYYDIIGPKITIAIGSIIGWYSYRNVVVWGSGIMYNNDPIKPAQFLAVRGEKTKQRLLELGYKAPTVLGDPALLLNLVYTPQVKKKYKIGIIPHYRHYSLLQKYNSEYVKVINLLDPIEVIIDNIATCELTLSTSLHGIIVSHVYNVPSLWTTFDESSEAKISGDDIKFLDYFSSVNIDEYSSIYISSVDLTQIDNLIHKLQAIHNKSMLIAQDKLKTIQKELLLAAPFPIKIEYLNKI